MSGDPKTTFNSQNLNTAPSYLSPAQELVSLVKAKNYEGIERLLNSNPNPSDIINTRDDILKQTPMYNAAMIKDYDLATKILGILIEKGGKIQIKDIHGQSPLFYICREGNLKALQLFLANSIDINESDNFKQSPLFYASRDGKLDCVKTMIQNGANPDHRDKVNETALFYAAREGRTEICKVLLDNGADVNMVDLKKQTALFFAKMGSHDEVVELLLSRGALNTKDGRLTKNDLNKLKKMKTTSIQESKLQSQKNSHRNVPKRKKNNVNEGQKQTYKLVFTGADLKPIDITTQAFEEFKQKYPQIAELILEPKKLESNKEALEELQSEKWQQVANKIITTVKKIKGANIFHHPVDHVKLGIPDYPTIIKKPMDFGTVKKKIDMNMYSKATEFLEDMELVFMNCRMYNGVDSYIGKIGVDVNREYDNLLQSYNFKERFENADNLGGLVQKFAQKLQMNVNMAEPVRRKDSIDEQIQTANDKKLNEPPMQENPVYVQQSVNPVSVERQANPVPQQVLQSENITTMPSSVYTQPHVVNQPQQVNINPQSTYPQPHQQGMETVPVQQNNPPAQQQVYQTPQPVNVQPNYPQHHQVNPGQQTNYQPQPVYTTQQPIQNQPQYMNQGSVPQYHGQNTQNQSYPTPPTLIPVQYQNNNYNPAQQPQNLNTNQQTMPYTQTNQNTNPPQYYNPAQHQAYSQPTQPNYQNPNVVPQTETQNQAYQQNQPTNTTDMPQAQQENNNTDRTNTYNP